jgi:hypothetical protein
MIESVICIGLICFAVGYCVGTSHCMREDMKRTIAVLEKGIK